MAGRKNIIFGFFYLLTAVSIGLVQAWPGSVAQGDTYMNGAVLQAVIDSMLNIFAGYLMARLPFSDWLTRILSPLMIGGAALRSGAGLLASFGFMGGAAASAQVLMPIGVLAMGSVMLFLSIGAVCLKAARQPLWRH